MDSPANVLLVDDELRNLDALGSFLQSPDYHLVRALTAEQALLLLLEGEFAVIVLDIQMPGMSGIELANLIKQRKRTRHIPIIFLTAYFQEDKDVLEGYGIGAVDYLTKPVNPQILKSKIGVFVDLFRKTRALAEINAALELEIGQRQKAEEALQLANTELESRVRERTTDLQRANEELRTREKEVLAARDEAMAASRAKDDFLATLSHELRTPLNPVLLLATDAAGNADLPERVREDFETIAKNVALEARLIDDLLDVTRIVRGKLSLERRPFDVHESLQDALAMVRREILEKGIVLDVRLEAARRVIHGDDVRLKQVFWNVIKNAVKFTPAGGRIVIESRNPPASATLLVIVTDTGIGMLPEELARVFEAFSQGDHASVGAHRFGGMGLGLTISRMMVELHAGSIVASSGGRDQGTTFQIELPVLPDGRGIGRVEKDAGGVSKPAAAPAAASPCRILLVEDHGPTSRALVQLLARRDYEVVVADCVSAALDAAGRRSFDLLISDIGLPDGNGYELMEALRKRHGLPGIALTGYGMEEDVNRSQEAGFIAHLTKPVSMQLLDAALTVAQSARSKANETKD